MLGLRRQVIANLPLEVPLNIVVCNAAPLNSLLGHEVTSRHCCLLILLSLSARLVPVHSPLLGKSLLLSFPPLNNMLKFSGYSCLI